MLSIVDHSWYYINYSVNVDITWMVEICKKPYTWEYSSRWSENCRSSSVDGRELGFDTEDLGTSW